ncbi:DUF551 domain-containing protein [Salmonella enterica subsp. enterica serovar Kentucky]|uniref:DUF551 domain-containing protein n=3 Tax=Salmonella enterica TaxID=28901 RepID=A0A610R808_SALER|nr:DUF551 domain-containing protein [Salmonella enterica]EBD0157080.1 DUF551 domain-containing protein [Salmonella enterica subsp. enterica serovar Newport]EBG6763659.1 DUF551 domain-containing protein [Salmonella enterica subsp. enterica]EBH9235210.1 DUF551 domain-containing protein [Salmonella enterica subsp. enterica serovar Manhattan]EBR9384391.1 DUF551 domain-containing protein [Salmonella enterica subsp. enterica serovar Ohio]EBZ2335185.1 DUF551 domain-containing protein [Salmonella ente
MTTITKEEVKAFIEQIESDLSNGWEAQIFELKLARIALASLEAEKGADPVVFTDERNLHRIAMGRETSLILGKQNQEVGDIPLYRHAQPVQVDKEFIPKNLDKALGVVGVALPESKEEFNFQIERWIQRLIDRVIRYADEFKEQPAPVVPDEMATSDDMNLYQKSFAQGYNACRAAMLQGVEPVSNHDELALYYLQGQKDGLEWAAQLAEANHPHTGDWLYDDPLELAKAIRKGPDMPEFAGSSPVTQDGWISCSERMPDKGQRVLVCVDFDSSTVTPLVKDAEYTGSTFRIGHNTINTTGETSVTHWMPLPAPPQQ